eukprot:GHVT01005327.1.p1 GENE.GHVT01005327.1~~GHVT01005327.1.p1  ORF type:complete len:192 (+),score=15.87 GHVT01005327.1:1030-1605(+)
MTCSSAPCLTFESADFSNFPSCLSSSSASFFSLSYLIFLLCAFPAVAPRLSIPSSAIASPRLTPSISVPFLPRLSNYVCTLGKRFPRSTPNLVDFIPRVLLYRFLVYSISLTLAPVFLFLPPWLLGSCDSPSLFGTPRPGPLLCLRRNSGAILMLASTLPSVHLPSSLGLGHRSTLPTLFIHSAQRSTTPR